MLLSSKIDDFKVTPSALDSLLLATKLYAARPRADAVPRPRLYALLDRALEVPLTLVVAPAGFGKTTLVVQWLEATKRSAAWLSLDTGDNDPASFLRYLIGALRTVAPQIGGVVLALLNAPQPPQPETLIALLINDLVAHAKPLLLVLDDYHALDNTQIHEIVRRLIQRLPPHVHLIITTREDPSLPLARFRARHQLVEVRASALRFTDGEAETFLREVMGLAISAEHVAALEARTEGWAAGLHLVALALQERRNVADFVAHFTGSHHFIVDYLAEEVLGGLPHHIRSFVLHISVLDRFCASLCDALVLGETYQSPYSQVLIDQMSTMNLFVIPLDDERHWYRFHHLFADALRDRLHHGTSPEQIAMLHRRASQWYEQQGLIGDAIKHALAAGDDERAAHTVEQRAESMLLYGDTALFVQWLSLLPEALIQKRPQLALAVAFHAMKTERLDNVERYVVVAERAFSAQAAGSEQSGWGTATDGWMSNVPAFTSQIRRILLRVRGDLAEATTQAEAALEHLPEHPFLRGWAMWDLAMDYWITGDLQAAERQMVACYRYGETDAPYLFGVVAGNLAQFYTEQGRLREAVAACQHALHVLGQQWGREMPLLGLIHAMLGDVLREWNQFSEAAHYLEQSIALGDRFASAQMQVLGYVPLARMCLAQGDYPRAEAAIGKAQLLTPNSRAQQVMNFQLVEKMIAFWLRQGKISQAVALAKQHAIDLSGPLDHMSPSEQLLHARYLVAQHDYSKAILVIEQLVAASKTIVQRGGLLELHVLHALALHNAGNNQQAQQALEFALGLAEPEGYIRVFVDEGPPMAALLRAAYVRGVYPTYCQTLLSAFEPADQSGVIRTSPARPTSPDLAEMLNERELEVLRLIAQGHSNREIADRLVVALSTVKWHINNLYGKLGVSTRTQALVRANELGWHL